MKTVLLSDLMRCPQMWHELIPLGRLRGADLELSDELAARLDGCGETVLAADATAREGVVPMPCSEWPLWARIVSLKASREDAGIGDTIARTIGPVGGDVFKEWYFKIVGKSCGCPERQEHLNQLYPL